MRIFLLSVLITFLSLTSKAQLNVKIRVDSITVLSNLDCDAGADNSDFTFEYKVLDNSPFAYTNNSPVAGSIGMCNYAYVLNNNGPFSMSSSPSGTTAAVFSPTTGVFFDRNYPCGSNSPTSYTLTWRGYENDDSSFPSTVPTAVGISSVQINVISSGLGISTYTAKYTSLSSDGSCPQTYVINFSLIKTAGTYTPLSIYSMESSTVCTGASTGTISPAVVGGSGTVTYDWSMDGLGDNDDLLEATGVGVGTYTFITKDALGCVDTRTITVTSVDPPSPLVGFTASTGTVCTGQTGVLYSTNTFTNVNYVWNYSGSATLSSAPIYSINIDFPSTATSGTLSVFAQNGCSVTPTIQMNITVNTTPTLSIAGSSTLCNNASETLTASGATGYLWNTGATTNSISISPTSTTIYTVTGNNFSCTSSKEFTVTSLPSPTVSITTPTTAVCPNVPVTLNATGSGSSYMWSDAVAGATHTVSSAYTTTYVVTNTATNTCFSTAMYSLTINPAPVISLVGSPTVCPSMSSTLSLTGAGSYSWSTGATTNSLVISPTSASSLTVIGTNTTTGCTSTKTINIDVFTVVPTVIVGSSTVCAGTQQIYTASGSWLYMWNNGTTASSNTITPTVASTINVIGTDLNGCKDTADFAITVLGTPTVSISGSDTICAGQPANLNANSSTATSYLWSNSSTLPNIVATPTTSTIYTVTISNGSCSGTASHTVMVKPSPIISFTLPTNICVDAPLFNLTATPLGGSYIGASVSGNMFNPAAGIGSYPISYTVGAINGCVSNATATMVVVSCIGVKEQEQENILNVFPNPTSTIINVNSNSTISKIAIADFTGKIIEVQTEILSNHQIDLTNYANGIYFFTIQFIGANSKTVKIVKQ